MTEISVRASADRYCNLLDAVKLVCALLVAAIHVPPLSSVNWILNFGVVNFVARIAVPFFFVSSAYFVFLKAYNRETDSIDKRVILKYVLRILRLYGIWSVVYLPFAYRNAAADMDFPHFILHYALRFLRGTSYGHLWYLGAVIYAYLILLALLSLRIKPRTIAGFSLTLYCLGVLTQSWYGLIEPLTHYPQFHSALLFLKSVFGTARNGLCEGLLFIVMGMLFAVRPFKLSVKRAVLFLALSFFLLCAEVFALAKLGWIREYDMYLGLIPTVFFLFYVSITVKLPDSPRYKKIRTLSSLIYFVHMIPAELLIAVPALRSLPGGSPSNYIFAVASACVLSFLIVRLSERFPRLRCLYK